MITDSRADGVICYLTHEEFAKQQKNTELIQDLAVSHLKMQMRIAALEEVVADMTELFRTMHCDIARMGK